MEDCERPHYANGLCVQHYRRRNQYGDPLAGPPMRRQRGTASVFTPDGRRRKLRNEQTRASARTYGGRHKVVSDVLGLAKGHPCKHCAENGIEKPARDWAAIHGTDGTDPHAHYIPLCAGCHHRYDGTGFKKGHQPAMYERTARGSRVGTSKLAEDQVAEIRARADTQSGASLAREFGVTPSNISSIVRGRSWQHVSTERGFEG